MGPVDRHRGHLLLWSLISSSLKILHTGIGRWFSKVPLGKHKDPSLIPRTRKNTCYEPSVEEVETGRNGQTAQPNQQAPHERLCLKKQGGQWLMGCNIWGCPLSSTCMYTHMYMHARTRAHTPLHSLPLPGSDTQLPSWITPQNLTLSTGLCRWGRWVLSVNASRHFTVEESA